MNQKTTKIVIFLIIAIIASAVSFYFFWSPRTLNNLLQSSTPTKKSVTEVYKKEFKEIGAVVKVTDMEGWAKAVIDYDNNTKSITLYTSYGKYEEDDPYTINAERVKELIATRQQKQEEYFQMWKKFFKEKNNLTEEQFKNQIKIRGAQLKDTIFTSSYTIKVDWVEAQLSDSFFVKFNGNGFIQKEKEKIFKDMPRLKDVATTEYLTESELAGLESIQPGYLKLGDVDLTGTVKLGSSEEVITYLKKSGYASKFRVNNYEYGVGIQQSLNKAPKASMTLNDVFEENIGAPYLFATALNGTQCFSVKINLYSLAIIDSEEWENNIKGASQVDSCNYGPFTH